MREEVTGGNGAKQRLRVCIKSFGCQMNMYDTEVAEGILAHEGYEIVNGGGRVREDDERADVVLMNTCSVREHAEDRVYGRLGMLGKAKKKNPELILGLMGCMVEEHREKLFKRFPQLDFMVGTRNIKDLPLVIDEVRKRRHQVAKIRHDGISIEYTDVIKRRGTFHAWLPIMTGCDKICTYCIVPITRGREVSMPAREVYREASRLVSEGVRWITLLGQNVNSYRGGELDGKAMLFPELLEMLCEIDGLERISFTTSHPHDATEELYRVIAQNPKISRRFHLPLQSASDRMLKRMARLHTFAEYTAKIDLMCELIPDVSVTTDIIAGFSGETEEDHEATKRALEEIRFDSAFVYKYSVRQGTPASKLPDDVPADVKEKRNNELLEVQRRITRENNVKWLGRTVGVFVEARSVKDANQLVGRMDQDKKVVFSGDPFLIGTFQKVRLVDLQHETLLGTL
ncbi:MAG: tRNA (N6-isopentenyl adenosine(37)-C2)-methylthiotransferase MiaB [Omnitrophica bacterium RIFCSPLOWO2_12_FULL_50_11]|nr:MAG: tRNA (N6-isopentenyl adenosine(37)-C2)-methylthiotransferase MiaB [Omnitrophica bacterium RIFCSPLOWO2_12_FULL_50_11]